MNIQITIQAPELVQAILALAASFENKSVNTVITAPSSPSTPLAPTPTNPGVPNQFQAAPPVTPVQNVVPLAPPVQQPAQVPPVQQQQPVPTTSPTYDMSQLAVAATQLMDAGRQSEIHSLLATFGVQTLLQLPHDQYGAFATKLRELGARI